MVTQKTILDLSGKSTDELEALWTSYSIAQDALYDDWTDENDADRSSQDIEILWLMMQIDIALGEEYGADDLPPHLRHLATF